MQNKIIRKLISRATSLGWDIVLTSTEIAKVEKELEIVLPKDFKTLCGNCSYEAAFFFEFYNFGDLEGVIGETLGLRKACSLPGNYLVLAMDDAGPVLMKINSINSAEVILCSYKDFENICKTKPYYENPTIFPTFVDFYEFLLDKEEKIQQ